MNLGMRALRNGGERRMEELTNGGIDRNEGIED